MPRWFVSLGLGAFALIAFACNDELVEDVTKDVCYSEKRWIGGTRGSPEMYPGRDCVGCHIDNDGPPLAIGGTIYPYVLGAPTIFDAQSGEDCFGKAGVVVTIEDNEGQIFEVTTNRAGNFYVEGNPDDFAKPFSAGIYDWGPDGAQDSPMVVTTPSYGGCARCHTPDATPNPPAGSPPGTEFDPDEQVIPVPRIGLPGNREGSPDGPTVEQELRSLAEAP